MRCAHRRYAAALCLLFVASSTAYAQAAETPALERGLGLTKIITDIIVGIANGAKSAYCSAVTVKDTWQARDERADMTQLSADLTTYEARKTRLIARIDRYIEAPKAAEWDRLRYDLPQTIAAVRDLSGALLKQTQFLGTVPQAGQKLLTTLDMKNDALVALQNSSAPTTDKELKQLRAFRTGLAKEVDALKTAHDAISAYITAKFEQKTGCP